jgi:hypothetical protein
MICKLISSSYLVMEFPEDPQFGHFDIVYLILRKKLSFACLIFAFLVG